MTRIQFVLLVILVAAAGLAGGALAGHFSAAPAVAETDQIVTARAFHVTDPAGRLVAALVSSREGEATLVFYDEAGMVRTYLGRQKDGSNALILYDKSGEVRASVRLEEDGGPSMNMFDAQGEVRAIFGRSTFQTRATNTVINRPEGSLVLFSETGRVSFEEPGVYTK